MNEREPTSNTADGTPPGARIAWPATLASALAALLAATGLALAAARWWMQGGQNVWTDLGKRLYVPDPDLGWRLIEDGPVWLGLDAVALCAGALAMALLAAVFARKRPQTRKPAAVLGWTVAALACVPGLAAFASGFAPDDAVTTPPTDIVEVPEGVQGGLAGLPAGTWTLAKPEAARRVVATIEAGGERFEGRFEATRAELRGDPSNLQQPLSLEVTVDPASVDTGIDGRSSHARQLLQVETHDKMTFRLAQLTGAQNSGPDVTKIGAKGELFFIGDTLDVEVTGEIKRLDDAARERLNIEGAHAFIVDVQFTVPIAQTKLSEYADDFGADTFPIRVNLIFVPLA